MQLPRILIQMLLLPILAIMLPLIYGIAWLREAMSDAALERAPAVVRHPPHMHRSSRR